MTGHLPSPRAARWPLTAPESLHRACWWGVSCACLRLPSRDGTETLFFCHKGGQTILHQRGVAECLSTNTDTRVTLPVAGTGRHHAGACHHGRADRPAQEKQSTPRRVGEGGTGASEPRGPSRQRRSRTAPGFRVLSRRAGPSGEAEVSGVVMFASEPGRFPKCWLPSAVHLEEGLFFNKLPSSANTCFANLAFPGVPPAPEVVLGTDPSHRCERL